MLRLGCLFADLLDEKSNFRAQETLGEKDVDLRAAQRDYTDQLKKARNTIDPHYNMSEPPRAVIKEWRNEGIDQLSAQDALRDIHVCENELGRGILFIFPHCLFFSFLRILLILFNFCRMS